MHDRRLNRPPLITLTTDFGTADGYAAAVKGVLAALAPEARLLDLTHEVPPHDVTGAAWVLLRAAPFFPAGAIHLAVVDPGVGSGRRGLVLEIGGQFFVGPDNGIFSLLPHRLAGPWRGVAIDRSRLSAPPSSSAVFEARDVFAPAAALLADMLAMRVVQGQRTSPVELSPLGEPITNWVRLPWTDPRREGEEWAGEVVCIDRFGNAVTNLTPGHGPGPLAVPGTIVEQRRVYADVPAGVAVALAGSSGFLEIAVNQGSASERLGLHLGDPVRLLPGAVSRPDERLGTSTTDRLSAPSAADRRGSVRTRGPRS